MTLNELIEILEKDQELTKEDKVYLSQWIRERLSFDAVKDHLDAARRVIQGIPKINIYSSGYLDEAEKWITEKKEEDETLNKNRLPGTYVVKVWGESKKSLAHWDEEKWTRNGVLIENPEYELTYKSKRSVLEMLGEK